MAVGRKKAQEQKPSTTAIEPTTSKRTRPTRAAKVVSSPTKIETKPTKKQPARRAPPRGKKITTKESSPLPPSSPSPPPTPVRSEPDLSKDETEDEHESSSEKPIRTVSTENPDFNDIELSKLINESTSKKSMTFLGNYKDQPAVVKIDKGVFDEETVRETFQDHDIVAEKQFANDIYSSYSITPPGSATALTNIQATLIWPANDSVIKKYSHSEYILFSETPDAYLKIVEPTIQNKLDDQKDYNNWVYNILDGKSEADRVLLNDANEESGFMLVHDLKWSGNMNDLKLIAICHRRDIRSLRDLNEQHLVLLKNILTKGTKAVKDKYKKLNGQLRTYIHYQPSFYHFHVHFKVVDAGDYECSDRDNLLSTVISNITLNKDYYRKSTLSYPLSIESPIYQALKKSKRV